MDAEYFQNLASYIENLSPDDKAKEEVYRSRTAICKDCDHLEAGLCRACGCYVELRAALKEKKCPYDKW